MARLLDPRHLPAELWDDSNKLLIIPDSLGIAFANVLQRHGMTPLLGQRDSDGPIGGASKEETEMHFVNRLDGSLARVQLVMLDPHDELATSSDTLISRLSGGVTFVADTPCGAGAGVLSALSVVAKLRKLNVLPRVPLDVRLVAADVSDRARELAAEMLDEVRPALAEEAINVSVEWIHWDATDVASNTNLVRRVTVMSDPCEMRLLLIANFSGFLALPGKTGEVNAQLDELFRYFTGPESYALWLEPDHNAATRQGGVIDWLLKRAREKWVKFAKLPTALGTNRGFTTRAKFKTLIRGGDARVAACVVPFVLDYDDAN